MPLTGGWNGRSQARPDQSRRRRRRDQHTRGAGDPASGPVRDRHQLFGRHVQDPAPVRAGAGSRSLRDQVRSERLLDTDRYPVITFGSESVDGLALTGTLTVRNVTMPVTLSIERTAARARWFDARASACIDRNEFGVTAYRGVAGRYLDMTIEVRCVRT
jgi:YceI-like domain